jgi:ABC-2 type transport system permease protein
MRVRSLQAGPIMQMPVFLILFLAPVYVPLALLEGWLHTVARYNPLTRLLETGRDFVAGQPAPAGISFAVALGLLAAFSAWAFRGLRKAEATN